MNTSEYKDQLRAWIGPLKQYIIKISLLAPFT